MPTSPKPLAAIALPEMPDAACMNVAQPEGLRA